MKTVGLLVLILSQCDVSLSQDTTDKLQDITDNEHYAASNVNYDDGGMGPMFDFARSFINTALPGGFPKEFVNETMSALDGKGGSLPISKILTLFRGYIAALAVGLLFVIIFPIVGCCFGCCRLCGNCGGKRKQQMTDNMNCTRRVFASILFGISVFMLAGNICTYVSNQRMSVAVDTIETTVRNNLDDVDTYLNLIQKQIEIIGVTNLNITKQHILENMDQTTMENKLTEYILNEMSQGALKTMEKNIESARVAFEKVTKDTQEVHSTFSTIQSLCRACQDPTNSPEFRDLATHAQDFDTFRGNSVVDKVNNQLKQEINTNLKNLSAQRTEVVKAFQQMEGKVKNVVDEVRNFKSNADSGIDLDSYKDKVTSATETIKKYDKYRFSAGAGLAAISTVIVTLQVLGLVFGTVGTEATGRRALPTQRSCMANSGGNLLVASVVFIFIFSSLLMLLTTVSFAVGSLLERFVCQPLTPPGFELLEVADTYFPTKDTLKASLPNVIRDCREAKTAYTAFHLSSMFNLTEVDDVLNKQEKKIDAQMQQAMNGIKNVGNINFQTTAGPSLTNFEDSLQNIQFQAIYQKLAQTKQSLPAAPQTGIFQNALTALENDLKQLEDVKKKVNGWSAALTNSLQDVTSKLGNAGEMDKILGQYKKRIVDIAETYVNTTKDNVENKVGKCTPLWNLYNSVLLVSICKYTIDAFNGFWFSIGWCLFFFIPAVIFSIKLSKYYRRMDYLDNASTSDPNKSIQGSGMFPSDTNQSIVGEGIVRNGTKTSLQGSEIFRSNKISHLDEKAVDKEE